MIDKTKVLFSSLKDKLSINLELVDILEDYYILIDNDKRYYHLYVLDYNEYNIYLDLKKSKYLKLPIEEIKYNDVYLLLYLLKLKKDKAIILLDRVKILENIYYEYSHTIKLSKKNSGLLKNQTRILNNKFSYFEMRIRNIEMKRIKNDLDWIILSKYHIILDSRIYLYDLLDDIFRYIDKEKEINIGLIFKNPFLLSYENKKIEPYFNLYYGPVGILYARIYIEYFSFDKNFLNDTIKKLDGFNKTYFLYSCIYILIIRLNFDIEMRADLFIDITRILSIIISNFGYITKESFK